MLLNSHYIVGVISLDTLWMMSHLKLLGSDGNVRTCLIKIRRMLMKNTRFS